MTVKKPAFIYSVIVETLKACRTPRSEYSLEDKVDTYTAAVIITMCKDAVDGAARYPRVPQSVRGDT